MKKLLIFVCFVLFVVPAFGQAPIVLVPPAATPTPAPLDELEKLELDAKADYQYIKPPGKPVAASDAPILHKTPTWSLLGTSIDGENKTTTVYFRDFVRTRDGAEVWLKFVYVKPVPVPQSRRKIGHTIQFASLDCDDKRISTESVLLYDTGGRSIAVPFSSLLDAYRKPIVPDSVGEMAWERFCR